MKTTLAALLLAAASCASCTDKKSDQQDRAICEEFMRYMQPPFSCETTTSLYHCAQGSRELFLYEGQFSSAERASVHYPHTDPYSSLLFTDHTTGAFCLVLISERSQKKVSRVQPALVSYH